MFPYIIVWKVCQLIECWADLALPIALHRYFGFQKPTIYQGIGQVFTKVVSSLLVRYRYSQKQFPLRCAAVLWCAADAVRCVALAFCASAIATVRTREGSRSYRYRYRYRFAHRERVSGMVKRNSNCEADCLQPFDNGTVSVRFVAPQYRSKAERKSAKWSWSGRKIRYFKWDLHQTFPSWSEFRIRHPNISQDCRKLLNVHGLADNFTIPPKALRRILWGKSLKHFSYLLAPASSLPTPSRTNHG